MSLLHRAKQISIAAGLYGPARWLSRRLRPRLLRELRDDTALYRTLVRPGALCFDVGANIGDKSEALLAAGARVVAFEPNPLLLPELQARCGRHKNWTLVGAGLSSTSIFGTLYARAAHVNSSLADGANVVATHHVPILTLDAAIHHFGVPAFCKIDVEGWELEVLKGLSRPIPLVAFEFQLGERGIQKTRGCLEQLAKWGAAHANLTPAETSHFHLKEWMPLTEFVAWFPGDLKQTLPGDHYGDIYVKLDDARGLT